jgi:ABC-type Na+ efflux pump permease subunit
VTVLVVAAVGIIAGVVNDDGADEYTVGAVGPGAEIVAAGANDLGRPLEVTIEVEDQPDAGAARAAVRDERVDAALVGDSIVSLRDPPAELVQLLQQSSRLVRTRQALAREGLSAEESERRQDSRHRALGLLQLALTAVIGLAAASASGAIELDAGDVGTLAVVLVWFLLGYLLWSSLCAIGGVMVSRQEDLQSSTTVLTVLLVIGYLLAFPAIDDPDGTLAAAASLFPLFAPIVMALDAASAVEIAASLAFLVAGTALLVPLGARLYERSVLRMGKPMKLSEAWRAART